MADPRWYVAQTHPQLESYALQHIQRQGFTAMLPLLQTAKRTEPLFPSYLFVHFNVESPCWRRLASTRGVRRLLGGEDPCPVKRGYVEALAPLRQDLPPSATWQPGITVLRVGSGPFAGHVGLYHAPAGERVKILLTLLGRNVVVMAPATAVEAA